MKKLVLLTLVLVFFLGGTAWAKGPKATGSGHLYVLGTQRTFSFTARELADGTVRGQAQLVLHESGALQHIELDCLVVDGNKATMSGFIKRTNVEAFEGASVWFEVFDHGEGGSANPDEITLMLVGGDDDCHTTGILDDFIYDIIGGNVQVH
jgi:hypothetical protein